MSRRQTVENVPSAARLGTALRDVGYDFAGAVADLIDNSLAAGATTVDITARFDGGDSWVRIVDNGAGMDATTINEALRFGSRRDYELDALGKFGLGLKTASLSQCRRLTVASRTSTRLARLEARAMDLEVMQHRDTWEIDILAAPQRPAELVEPLSRHPGTVVLWQDLDRLLPYRRPDGEAAKKGLDSRLELLDQHLGMVFHRFLAGEVPRRRALKITINGTAVEAWDPFARDEAQTERLSVAEFDVIHGPTAGVVTFQPFVLPNKHQFSTPSAHEHHGRGRWNQRQGLWIYRANRLIQDGGWRYLRTADEHTKYARAAIDFSPDLDDAFGLNIAKMRVNLPATLKNDLRAPVDALVRRAKSRYAEGNTKVRPDPPSGGNPPPPVSPRGGPPTQPGHQGPPGQGETPPHSGGGPHRPLRPALEEAASAIGKTAALKKIMAKVRELNPGAADALGW